MYGKQQNRRNLKETNTASESRNKRFGKQLTLRKQKKNELLKKKRKDEPSSANDPELLEKLKNINELSQQLRSPDSKTQLSATTSFRKILSMAEKAPPIEQVIQLGVIKVFIAFLQQNDNPDLQFEAAWALTNIASGTSDHTKAVVGEGAVPIFINLLSSPNDEVKEQAVWALGNISGDSAEFRDYVLQCGVLAPLIKIIAENKKLTILRNATWLLSNLCRGKPIPNIEYIKPAVPVLAHLLYNADEEVLTDACWAISYFSDGPNDRIDTVVKANITRRLVELLMHHHPSIQTPALRTIGNIVTGTEDQTQIVINSGALNCLRNLLTHQKKNIRKETCWTISNVTAGTENQIKSIIDANIIPVLIKILTEDDFDVRKEAAWALSNATSGGTPSQIVYLVSQGCIKPLCDLLNAKDVRIILVALEGLENILEHGSELAKNNNDENPYAEYIDKAGGAEKIEELQYHKEEDIYEKARHILEEYYGGEEDDEEDEEDEEMNNEGFSFNQNTNNQQNFNF